METATYASTPQSSEPPAGLIRRPRRSLRRLPGSRCPPRDLAATANDLTQTFSYTPASQIGSVTRSNDLYAWTGHTNDNLGSTPNGLNQIANVAITVTVAIKH